MWRDKTLQEIYYSKQDMKNILHEITILIFMDNIFHPSSLESFQFDNFPSMHLHILVTTIVRVKQDHIHIWKIIFFNGNENYLHNRDIYKEKTNHEWISQEVFIHLRYLQCEEAVQLLLC